MKHINVSEFKNGNRYSGAYILKQHAVKSTSTGSQYLDMVLMDKTGEIPAKLWSLPAGFNVDAMTDGWFIAVAVSVEDYRGRLQAKVDNIKLITDTSNFDVSEILPCAPEPADKMWAQVITAINDMMDEEIQRLCLTIVMDNKDALFTCPGAKSMHHAEVGGLLHHMTGMLSLAQAVEASYPQVNRDLLNAGVILHDICKPREFALGPLGLCTDYTKEGKLLGHITMGVSYLEAKCRELGISEETRTLMCHMLLSHHGKPEFGSAIAPAFLEAILLNKIDDIDSKINMVEHALEGVDVGNFSDRCFGLDGIQVYNHGRKNI